MGHTPCQNPVYDLLCPYWAVSVKLIISSFPPTFPLWERCSHACTSVYSSHVCTITQLNKGQEKKNHRTEKTLIVWAALDFYNCVQSYRKFQWVPHTDMSWYNVCISVSLWRNAYIHKWTHKLIITCTCQVLKCITYAEHVHMCCS